MAQNYQKLQLLIVDISISDENCIAELSKNRMNILQLSTGSYIYLRSLNGGLTVCAVKMNNTECTDDKILLNKIGRYNLKVKINDPVEVILCKNMKHGKKVEIEVFKDSLDDYTG